MRLFVAIELSDPVRMHLVNLRDTLKAQLARASLTRDENLHITLKFLGEVDARRADELSESLALVRAGGGPMEIRAEHIECFPNRGPIRIIAAGFGGAGAAGLSSIHRAIEQRCQHLGFERETRKYRPHVTLARARPTLPGSIRSVIADAARTQLPGPALAISAFSLVQSVLTPAGSHYQVLTRFPLNG